MSELILDFSKSQCIKKIDASKDLAFEAKQSLLSFEGEGSDFLGWINWPFEYDQQEYERIKALAKRLQSEIEYLVVVGIGGSYLGTRAIEYALSTNIHAHVKLIYLGHHLCAAQIDETLKFLEDKRFAINVISKSGTTTEPAIAFRLVKKLLIDKMGPEKARQFIFATTDSQKGALKTLADQEGYETFTVPDNIGGRFSVFSAVGLLPLAIAGVDIDALMHGARRAAQKYTKDQVEDNEALQYALYRNLQYRGGKRIEILALDDPRLFYIAEWWKQLFGESEGKEHKGLFPASVCFTTDLHSMGQWIQDGYRNIIETVLSIDKPTQDLTIALDEDNLDGLNYLAGKSVDYVNKMATEGVIDAHAAGGVPIVHMVLPELNEENIGFLLYFFCFSVAISGKILGVNPFNQPGVEKYKSNMFKLLEKPGY